MPIFLACISFTLIYTVVSVKVVNPKLALDTVKTVLGGDGVFEFPDRKDIYHGDDTSRHHHRAMMATPTIRLIREKTRRTTKNRQTETIRPLLHLPMTLLTPRCRPIPFNRTGTI